MQILLSAYDYVNIKKIDTTGCTWSHRLSTISSTISSCLVPIDYSQRIVYLFPCNMRPHSQATIALSQHITPAPYFFTEYTPVLRDFQYLMISNHSRSQSYLVISVYSCQIRSVTSYTYFTSAPRCYRACPDPAIASSVYCMLD